MDISKYWKTIMDTLRDGLMIVDSKGIIQAVNPAAERLTGYSAAELIGSSCRILNCTGCDVFGTGSGKKWCRLFSTGGIGVKECMISSKDRRSLHIIKNASVLRNEHGQMIGAVETLTDISEMIRQREEILSLRKTFHLDDGYHGILGKSPVMQRLFELIEHVARTDAPVMIYGQSGAGKELIARAIHERGTRGNKPFIKVNCAALNENLLESELFGHVRGAFTGAEKTRMGRFEAAHEGTILLDEIGDIPLSIQVKLLRVLEEKVIERVGDHTPIPVNVRIISATNRNLESLIATDNFREDLFFRINVFPLYCPSLAERKEDIPLLVDEFIRQNGLKTGKKIIGVTPEAMEMFLSYSWPGNVRELRNAIEYAFVLCPEGRIGLPHLPMKILNKPESCEPAESALNVKLSEREKLIQALRESGGSRSEAARILGVSRVTVWKWMKKFNIRSSFEEKHA